MTDDEPQTLNDEPPLNAASRAVMAAMMAIIYSDLPASRINPIFFRLTEISVPAWDDSATMELSDEQAVAWAKILVANWTMVLFDDPALIERFSRNVPGCFKRLERLNQGYAEDVVFYREDLRAVQRKRLGMSPFSPEEWATSSMPRVQYKPGHEPKEDDEEPLIY